MVYITMVNGHDLSDARRFGELTYLLTHGFNPHALERVTLELIEKLQHFKPDEDYLLPVGQDMANLTATWLLAQLHNNFRVLYWDFRERQYVPQQYHPRLFEQVKENLKLKEEMLNGNKLK